MNSLENTEVRVPVQPVRVTKYCAVDGSPLRSTGYSYPMSPPLYPHECPTCGGKVNFKQVYPTIEFE